MQLKLLNEKFSFIVHPKVYKQGKKEKIKEKEVDVLNFWSHVYYFLLLIKEIMF
jgi:hypothetical protein